MPRDVYCCVGRYGPPCSPTGHRTTKLRLPSLPIARWLPLSLTGGHGAYAWGESTGATAPPGDALLRALLRQRTRVRRPRAGLGRSGRRRHGGRDHDRGRPPQCQERPGTTARGRRHPAPGHGGRAHRWPGDECGWDRLVPGALALPRRLVLSRVAGRSGGSRRRHPAGPTGSTTGGTIRPPAPPAPSTPPPAAPAAPAVPAPASGPGPKITGTNGVGARLRAAPSLKAATVLLIPEGATVEITGTPQSAEGYEWMPVRYSGQSGWVASSLLSASAIPAPNPEPTPPPVTAPAPNPEPTPPPAAAPTPPPAPPSPPPGPPRRPGGRPRPQRSRSGDRY